MHPILTPGIGYGPGGCNGGAGSRIHTRRSGAGDSRPRSDQVPKRIQDPAPGTPPATERGKKCMEIVEKCQVMHRDRYPAAAAAARMKMRTSRRRKKEPMHTSMIPSPPRLSFFPFFSFLKWVFALSDLMHHVSPPRAPRLVSSRLNYLAPPAAAASVFQPLLVCLHLFFPFLSSAATPHFSSLEPAVHMKPIHSHSKCFLYTVQLFPCCLYYNFLFSPAPIVSCMKIAVQLLSLWWIDIYTACAKRALMPTSNLLVRGTPVPLRES